MNITLEEKGPCKKLLKIELTYADIKDEVEKIQRSVQQNANIPGFRVGKVPWNLVEQYYGNVIENEIKQRVIQAVYPKVFEEKNIHPVTSPTVSGVEYKKGHSLDFVMEVETAPKFELPQYKGMSLEEKRFVISDEDINKELKYLQDRYAQFEVVSERPISMGDYAVVDYEIMQKKEVIDQAKQVWIELKDDFFIPKFCSQIVGMKKGESKDIKVTLPKTYPKPELNGKKVSINLKLNEIKVKSIPPINDDFAKQAGEFSSLGELKSKIKDELTVYYEKFSKRDLVSQIENHLLKKTYLDIPPSIMSNTHDAIYKDKVAWLKNTGKVDDNLIKEKESEIRDTARIEATDQLKLVYIMEEIAITEKIEVSEEELNSHIEEAAKQSGKSVKEVFDYLNKENKMWNFKYKIRNEKIIDYIIENANKKQVDTTPESVQGGLNKVDSLS